MPTEAAGRARVNPWLPPWSATGPPGGISLIIARCPAAPLPSRLRLREGLAYVGEQAAGGEPPPIHAAEATARRTAEMAARLGEVALDLRASVGVVRGFAEYCRLRSPRPSAGLDRMAERVAEEAARMETLIERLGPADPPSPPRSVPRSDRNTHGPVPEY